MGGLRCVRGAATRAPLFLRNLAYFLKRIIGKINSALSRPESCGSAVECHLYRTLSFPQGLISFLARQYTRCSGVFLLVAGKIFDVGQP